ncbi:16S rRNA (uracil(1498)-N(3))-methyltransferase [Planktosalinus lacus]|uniref:Ribosomal RNA small subunit methyltransferase E n=1 Tax=Planktosalinus lacus TaxID=1526573 RepID=A0A8J2VAP6_9FLAO|nr:16S rRNA (uracil(1498)-N(3))-methyltransferase [Planktosalinus lacus]GGD93285.1 ribosomal RNA small subunit methyltransferase E [Planktosalinus lacus]
MQLFYHPEAESIKQHLVFDKDESRHIVKVLRKNSGDELLLTNGKGYFFSAEIVTANHNKCGVKLLSKELQSALPYSLHMAVAPTKLNDRFEWFLEKATEIGVSEVTPVICEHSERTKIKLERYEKIVLSAMKQSLKAYLPKINAAISFNEFIKVQSENNTMKCIAHCEDGIKKELKEIVVPNEFYTILIGPEGDFSAREIKLALKHGFQPVSLGNSRLRTETAAIVAVHSIAFLNQ